MILEHLLIRIAERSSGLYSIALYIMDKLFAAIIWMVETEPKTVCITIYKVVVVLDSENPHQ
jgi:hypothetical protein